MVVTEQVRRELYEAVRVQFGERIAEHLMAVTLPANTDLATRADIAELRAELKGDIAEVRGDIAVLRAELRGEVSASAADLRGEMSELRTDLYRRFLPSLSIIVAILVGLTNLLTR